jgi:NADH-ubiquinone oxidoreductase chain 1
MINNNFVLNISNLLISLIDVLAVLLPVLLAVAFMTIIERKQLASMQRRVGPNTVGYFGVLQPFAKFLINN